MTNHTKSIQLPLVTAALVVVALMFGCAKRPTATDRLTNKGTGPSVANTNRPVNENVPPREVIVYRDNKETLDKLKAVETERDAKVEELKTLQARLATLQRDLKSRDDQVAKASGEIAGYTVRIRNLEDTVMVLNKKIQELSTMPGPGPQVNSNTPSVNANNNTANNTATNNGNAPDNTAVITGRKPTPPAGYTRIEPENGNGFGFDYPSSWTHEKKASLGEVVHVLSNADKTATLQITLWQYPKDNPKQMVQRLFKEECDRLTRERMPLTIEEEPTATRLLEGKDTFSAQLKFDDKGNFIRKRFAAAHIPEKTYDSIWTFVQEMTYDVRQEEAMVAVWTTVAESYWPKGE